MQQQLNSFAPVTSGARSTLWLKNEAPEFSPLNQDIQVDVCIVGGGIAGITLAYLLTKEGRSIALVEVCRVKKLKLIDYKRMEDYAQVKRDVLLLTL